MKMFLLLCLLCFFPNISSNAQPVWQSNLDGKIRFYQTTDFGVILAGTNNSLYAIDGQTGYGSIARAPNLLNRVSGLQVINPANIRGKIIGGAINKVTPSRADVQESVFERLDPVRQVEKLSDYLLRRKRLADLRGGFMYFYTDLPKPFDKKGLIGVNVHTGKDARFILIGEPDSRFTIDETAGLFYSADVSQLQTFDILDR